MQRISWYPLFAVGALLVPFASRAQRPKAQAPQAKVRELATIEGAVTGFLRLPHGRILIYTVGDSTFAYDVATKDRTLIGTDMSPKDNSPQGDRLAFSRSSEDHKGTLLWTMPIDPKTGMGTGPAQRVSLREGSDVRARFSPDGKTLTYSAGALPDGTFNLTLVPATGGPERVVANYPEEVISGWSADGKSIYVEGGPASTAIERISVSGGRTDALFPKTALTGHWVVGLSRDARVAIFQDNPNRFYYRTASGEEGEIRVPLPPLDDGWGYDLTLEAMRYATMTQVHHNRVRILDVATGQARDLLPGNVPTSAPAWSPDGRRIAVLIGNLSHYEIAIMNADGSALRRYPLPSQLDGWGDPWGMPWSPDGRFLAFRTRDRRQVGYNDGNSQLALLDVKSGETRVLASASPGNIDDFVWRSDGNAVRAGKVMRSPTGQRRTSIVEIAVDGAERQLRDVTAEFPTANGAHFSSDREAVVTVKTDTGIDRYVVPLGGGVARRLADPGIESSSGGVLTGVDGKRVFVNPFAAGSHVTWVTKILSTTGNSTRTLRLPFGAGGGANYPGGTQVLYVGKVTGDSLWTIFLVPLDGSTPRRLGEIPGGGVGGKMAASPDGKFVAYTSEGRYTSKILEIDFGPVLQAILKP